MFRLRISPGSRTLRYALVGVLAFSLGSALLVAARDPLVEMIKVVRLADGTNSNNLAAIDAAGNVAVHVSNFPATENVSGAVSVTNLPSTQAVTGSVNVGNFPATQQVAGTVNLGNSPTVQAQQSGVWSVAVSGTPKVGIDPSANTVQLGTTSLSTTVTSSETNPIFTRDVDNAARHSFQIRQSRFDTSTFLQNTFTVPTDSVLVIEYVSVAMNAPHAAIMEFSVETTANGIVVQHLVPTAQRDFFANLSSGPTDSAIATSSLRLYADPGSTVKVSGCIFCGNGGTLASYGPEFISTVSGYLVKR